MSGSRIVVLGFATGLVAQALGGESGISSTPVFSAKVRGDFAVVGSSSRVRNGSQPPGPVTLTNLSIPQNATVIKAYANWSFLTNQPGAGSERNIKLNGISIQGAVSYGNPDLNWGLHNGAAYLADVTDIVREAGRNASYSFSGVTDNALTGGIGEGVSLLVVYDTGVGPLNQVNVYSGYTSTMSGLGGATLRFGQGAYVGGSAHFFTNALDGQAGLADEFLINGRAAGLSGSQGDYWRGSLGFGAAGLNYYDHAEGDIRSLLRPGATSLDFLTLGFSSDIEYQDCIGHSFAAFSTPVPEPGAWVPLVGMGCLLLRRRR